MKKSPAFLMPAVLAAFTLTAQAQVTMMETEVFWNFGTDTANYSPSITPPDAPFAMSNIMGGNPISVGNGLLLETGTAMSPTPTYSGQYNANISARTNAFNESLSAYYSCGLTHLGGVKPLEYTLSKYYFGTRSATTGPAAWTFIAYTNGVGVILGTNTIIAVPNQWQNFTITTNFTFASTDTVEFRLYGHSGSGNASGRNWRIDDLRLTFTHEEAPPSLLPPVLRVAGATTSSITVEWDTIAAATEGYLFDASRFPTFIETLVFASCAIGGSALNDWTVTVPGLPDAAGTGTGGPGLLLVNDNKLLSPLIDLTGISNAILTFNSRRYGTQGTGNLIYIETSPNGLPPWTLFASYQPANNTFSANPTSEFSMASFANQQFYMRISAPNNTTNVGTPTNATGAGVNNIRIQAVVDSYITPYRDFATENTSVELNGLAANTTYYFRARSVGDENETTGYSTVLSAKTLDDTLAPVVLLTPDPVKHNTATLHWQPHPNATGGYQIEVYRTNHTSSATGPCVIISKAFKGYGEAKVVELTNIGNQTALLSEYDLRRDTGTGFGAAWTLASGTATNGVNMATLAPGASVLFVRNACAHLGINALPAIRHTSFQVTNGNTMGLFRNGVHTDSAPFSDYSSYARASIVSAGRLAVDVGEWTKTTVPGGATTDYASFNLLTHVCSVPHFPEVMRTAGASATSFNLSGLRFRTEHTYRVRAIGSDSYSPWSNGTFTTLEPPKGTIFIVR